MSYNSSRWNGSSESTGVNATGAPVGASGYQQQSSNSGYYQSQRKAALNVKYVEYAGFWLRFWAYVIDTLAMGAVIAVPMMMSEGLRDWIIDPSNTAMLTALSIIIPWLYFAGMESGSGGTFGKLACGLKVTDMEGNNISFLRATGRHFGKIVSQLILDIGYLIVAFTDQKQGLHDMMAGCLVVKNIR